MFAGNIALISLEFFFHFSYFVIMNIAFKSNENRFAKGISFPTQKLFNGSITHKTKIRGTEKNQLGINTRYIKYRGRGDRTTSCFDFAGCS